LTGSSIEIYSRPVSCDQKHFSPHGVDHVQTAVEVDKIGLDSDVAGLTACLVVINVEDSNEETRVLHGNSIHQISFWLIQL